MHRRNKGILSSRNTQRYFQVQTRPEQKHDNRRTMATRAETRATYSHILVVLAQLLRRTLLLTRMQVRSFFERLHPQGGGLRFDSREIRKEIGPVRGSTHSVTAGSRICGMCREGARLPAAWHPVFQWQTCRERTLHCVRFTQVPGSESNNRFSFLPP